MIAAPKYIDIIEYENGKTKDIIKSILDANEEPLEQQTKAFAKQFERSKNGLKKLWEFVKYQITYREDPEGVQWIKEPSRLWADRVGDCKSFTIFICSILKNLKIDYTIRFVTYSPQSNFVTHVYPIAHLNGEDIILDAVWKRFNAHKQPYYLKKDYFFKMEISRLSGIGSSPEENLKKLQNVAAHFESVTKNLSPGVDDVTSMTENQSITHYGKIKGIGSITLPAVIYPTIITDAEGIGNWFKKAGNWVGRNVKKGAQWVGRNVKSGAQWVGRNVKSGAQWVGRNVKKGAQWVANTAKKVAADIKKFFQKLVKWIVNTALKPASGFFLYTFITNENGLAENILKKKKRQEKILTFISKMTGISQATLMSTIKGNIEKKHGKSVSQIINEKAGRTIASIGVIDPVTITAVVDIVMKIINFFKKDKSEAPEGLNAETASDPNELAAEPQQQKSHEADVIKEIETKTHENKKEQEQGYNPNQQGQGYNPNQQEQGYNPNQQGQGYIPNPQGQGYNPNQQGQRQSNNNTMLLAAAAVALVVLMKK